MSFPDPYSLPFFVPYDEPATVTDHGSETLNLDGAPGSLATARVARIIFGDPINWIECWPLAGEPTRLAAIEVR